MTTTAKNNITKDERKALTELKNNDSIIIKEADKGGATVIMDKTFYQTKIQELLSDSENYAELTNGNKDGAIIRKIEKLLKKFEHETTKKEKEYIKNFVWKTSNLYGLPKIHKSKEIKEAINEKNTEYIKLSAPSELKMRPIVAGPLSPTHRLSNFVDIILKPLCEQIPSFIRDDLDFLQQIPQEIDEDSILVSFDVVSLYTNIPHDLGLTAIEYWLDNYKNFIARPFSKEFILEAISIVLKENTFHFDGKFYRQIQGTAMGTKMAPTYATLVMGYLEKQLYSKYEQMFGNEDKDDLIKIFKRFLDDCFTIWKKSEEDLTKFHMLLNSLHEKIKFTMEKSNEKLPFLDVLLYKDGKELHTDIFYKETDTHQYLNFNSCHPKHTKQNIPYSLARRICCIVSKQDVRKRRLIELQQYLEKQNYPRKIIMKGIEKATSLTEAELKTAKKTPQNNNALPLVITHNPNNLQIIGKIKQDMIFLNNSSKMKSILDNTTLIVSRRQPKSLKQYLTHAQYNSEKPTKHVSKCNESRCGTCKVIITGNSITLKSGKTWEIKSPMDCKSKNVIYVITCCKCNSFYVGQTEHLRKRVTLHREQISHQEYRHLEVSKHLAQCNNGEFQIMPIYQCKNATRLFRETKEQEIIGFLKPDLNCN